MLKKLINERGGSLWSCVSWVMILGSVKEPVSVGFEYTAWVQSLGDVHKEV